MTFCVNRGQLYRSFFNKKNIPIKVFLKNQFLQHQKLCLKLFNVCSNISHVSRSRPPDRRRRDLFGVANATSIHTLLSGNWNMTKGNFSDDQPPRQEFSFLERKVKERTADISGLQPFTVYRIDVHACNEEVRHCSAAAFVFSRTKPAGKIRK